MISIEFQSNSRFARTRHCQLCSIGAPCDRKEPFWTPPPHNATEDSQNIGEVRSPLPRFSTRVAETHTPLSRVRANKNNNSRNVKTLVPAENLLNALDECIQDISDNDLTEDCDSDADSVIDTSESYNEVIGENMTMYDMTKVTAKCHWLTKRYQKYIHRVTSDDLAEKKPALNPQFADFQNVKFRLQAMTLLTGYLPLLDDETSQEQPVNNSCLTSLAEEGRLPWTQTAADKEADVFPCWSEDVHPGISDLVKATVEVESEVSSMEKVDHQKRIEFQKILAFRKCRRREKRSLRLRQYEYSRSHLCSHWPKVELDIAPIRFYRKEPFCQGKDHDRAPSWQKQNPYYFFPWCEPYTSNFHLPLPPPTSYPLPPHPLPPPHPPLHQQPHSGKRQVDVESKHYIKTLAGNSTSTRSHSSLQAVQTYETLVRPKGQPCEAPTNKVKLISRKTENQMFSNIASPYEEEGKNKSVSLCDQTGHRKTKVKLKRRVTFDLSKNKVKVVSRYLTSWKHGVKSQRNLQDDTENLLSNQRKSILPENIDVSGDWLKDTKSLLKGARTELMSIQRADLLTAPSLSGQSEALPIKFNKEKWLAKCKRRKSDKKKTSICIKSNHSKMEGGSNDHRLQSEKMESTIGCRTSTSQKEGVWQTESNSLKKIGKGYFHTSKADSVHKTAFPNTPSLRLVTNQTAGSRTESTILNNQESGGQYYNPHRLRGAYDKDNVPINNKTRKYEMEEKEEKQTFETVDEVSESQNTCLGKLTGIKSPAILDSIPDLSDVTSSSDVRRRVSCHNSDNVSSWNTNISIDNRGRGLHMGNMHLGGVAPTVLKDERATSCSNLLIILITIIVFFLSKFCLLFL